MRFLAILLVLLACASVVFAQSPEDVEKEMRDIEDQMGKLERLLARASVDSEEAEALLKSLYKLANREETEVPKNVKDFLFNNPNILEKLTGKTNKEVERLLKTDAEFDALLKGNFKLFKQLLENQELVLGALQRHNKVENDLKNLFAYTTSEMKKTEEALKKLVDMASKTQLQNSNQNNQSSKDSDKPDPKSLDREKEKGDAGKAKQNASDDYSRFRSPNEADPRVWKDPTAVRPGESTLGALSGTLPREYEQELAEYMKALAKTVK